MDGKHDGGLAPQASHASTCVTARLFQAGRAGWNFSPGGRRPAKPLGAALHGAMYRAAMSSKGTNMLLSLQRRDTDNKLNIYGGDAVGRRGWRLGLYHNPEYYRKWGHFNFFSSRGGEVGK